MELSFSPSSLDAVYAQGESASIDLDSKDSRAFVGARDCDEMRFISNGPFLLIPLVAMEIEKRHVWC